MSADDVLERVGDRLAAKFAGVFSRETVHRYVAESYTGLLRTSRLRSYLPALTERFAAERLTALAQSEGVLPKPVPEVLFVCVQNAGRSQLAAALLDLHAHGRVNVRSAGSQPAGEVHPSISTLIARIGVQAAEPYPKPLTDAVVGAADVVITMGCGDACPLYPGKRYLDWDVVDPADATPEQVHALYLDLDERVRALLEELVPTIQEIAP